MKRVKFDRASPCIDSQANDLVAFPRGEGWELEHGLKIEGKEKLSHPCFTKGAGYVFVKVLMFGCVWDAIHGKTAEYSEEQTLQELEKN